jgi:hypothetical protein
LYPSLLGEEDNSDRDAFQVNVSAAMGYCEGGMGTEGTVGRDMESMGIPYGLFPPLREGESRPKDGDSMPEVLGVVIGLTGDAVSSVVEESVLDC